MYILPPSISKKIEGYRWQGFTPPAAGKSRRFRGLICHRRSHRLHQTLKITPAMAAGVTEKLWEMADIVKLIDEAAPKLGPRGPYKKRVSNSN